MKADARIICERRLATRRDANLENRQEHDDEPTGSAIGCRFFACPPGSVGALVISSALCFLINAFDIRADRDTREWRLEIARANVDLKSRQVDRASGVT